MDVAKLEASPKQREDLQKWYLYGPSKTLQNHSRVTSVFTSSAAWVEDSSSHPLNTVPQRRRVQLHQGEPPASALSIGHQDTEAIRSTRQKWDLVTTPGRARGNTRNNARVSGMAEETEGNVFPT